MTTSPYEGYEDLQPAINDRLRIARERRTGLDQETFADRIGVSRGTVSNYERGKMPGGPRQRLVLNSWASECEVTRTWLETGTAPTGDDGGGNVGEGRFERPTFRVEGRVAALSHRRRALAPAA